MIASRCSTVLRQCCKLYMHRPAHVARTPACSSLVMSSTSQRSSSSSSSMPSTFKHHYEANLSAFPHTQFTQQFDTPLPLLLGPMAGATDTTLCIAAMKAGAFGAIAVARTAPAAIREQIKQVREATNSNNFAVNLFIPPKTSPPATDEQKRIVQQIVAEHIAKPLGITAADVKPQPAPPSYKEQFAAMIEGKPAAFGFTFGIPSNDEIKQCKELGIKLIGTATTAAEAIALVNAGCDAITVQGSEAGGHRGTFLMNDTETINYSTVGLLSLLKQCREVVPQHIPLIAAGGIADGATFAAALIAGASACTVGTGFLTAKEAKLVTEVHKNWLLAPYRARQQGQSVEQQVAAGVLRSTAVTRAYTGKPARGFRTKIIDAFNDHASTHTYLPWGIQDQYVQPYANYAKSKGNNDFMQLWAGQNYALCQDATAAEIVQSIIDSTNEVLRQLHTQTSKL